MLSSKYRLRLEYICKRIADRHEVQLEDMIWADKLAKANRSAGEMLRKARRVANNPDMQQGSLDDFLNQMAGTLDNTFTALIFPEEDVPDWIRRGAERTYAKNVLPFEAEAMWAMYIEDKTKEALEVCAGPKKMWEYYAPTPLTGEWLEQEGFIKKKS